MTWLLARQHRTFSVVALISIVLFAIVVVLTGVHMADVYASARQCENGRCLQVGRLFQGYGAIVDVVHLTLIVPVVFVAFGATLVARETESHTNVLVWTQSVPRRRWLVMKILAAVAAALVVAGVVSALVTWWSGTPNSLYGNRFEGAQFDTQNVVPVADALFGVAIGLAAGAWWRRVVPALASGIALYIGVRLVTAVYLRPRFGPIHTALVVPDADTRLGSGSWNVGRRLLDPRAT